MADLILTSTITAGAAGAGAQPPQDFNNVKDGNPLTYCQFHAGGAGGSLPERWITAAFAGGAKWIDRFTVLTTGDIEGKLATASTPSPPNQYVRFKYSTDGSSFADLTVTKISDDGNLPALETYQINGGPVLASHVRLYAAGKGFNNIWSGMNVYTWATPEAAAPSTDLECSFTATPTSGPAPLTVDFEDLTTGDPPPTSWLWDFGDGATSTLQDPTHEYAAPGAYTVTLTASRAGGSPDECNATIVDVVEVTDATAWDIYDAGALMGPKIATLEHASGRWIRSELHGLGEGGFTINRHATEATEAILAEGNMVKVRIEDCGPDYIDGFFLPGEGDYTLLSSRGGKGQEKLVFRGPGALAYLDRARMTRCAFSIEDTLTGTWTELWKTKDVGQPVGAAFDPAEPGYVYVGSGAARKVRKVDQTTREVVSSSPALWSGTTKYLGGISFDPDDSTILWALEIPWLAGSTANTKIRKVRRSDWAILDTFDLGSAIKLTDIRVDGDFIWTPRYDNNVIQQRSKATGAVVDSSTITFRGKVQQKPNGIAINTTSGQLAYWFGGDSGGGTGRALLADTSDPWTITGVQKTTGISAFGGEWYSVGADQFLVAVSYTEGRTWKYQLTDAVAACADDSGVFHPEQVAPGALAWRVVVEITHFDRPSQPCPELSWDFTETHDSNGTAWPARTSTEEFTWRVGDRAYSDVLARLIPAGVTFDLDVNTMTLHAYVDAGFGTDRTSATFTAGKVRFQEGTNLAVNGDLGRRDNRGQPDTDLTVLGDGAYGAATLAGRYVREGFLQVSGPTTEAVLDAIGDDELARQRLVSDALGFETLWASNELAGRYIPKLHYWKGDLVTVDMVASEFAYNEEEVRIYGTLITERDGGWRAALDLGSAYKVPPPITSIPGDSSGGSGSGGGSSGGTTVVTSIPLTVSDGEDVNIPRVTKLIAEGVTSPEPGVAIFPSSQTSGDATLRELPDVEAEAIADGQAIVWDAAAEQFIAELGGAMLLKNVISPAQLTADQNDYSPTDWATASAMRLSTDASRAVTGFAAPSPARARAVLVSNVGAEALVLANQSASSVADNRIITGTGADLTVAADSSVLLVYDETTERWRVIGGSGGGGGPVAAEDVTYDPTTSGLTATDAQAAIDELNAAIVAGGIPGTIVDGKGELIVGTAADMVDNLAVGANGSALIAASGEATGLKWRLNNDAAAAAPTVNDDSGDGYAVGSRWLDTTNDVEYVCLDATVGAAVWRLDTATRTRVYEFTVAAGATHTIPDGSVPRQASGLLFCNGTDGNALFGWYRDGTFNAINGTATPTLSGAAPNIFFRLATFSAGATGFSIYLSSNVAGATINIKNNNAYPRNFRLFLFAEPGNLA